jgi:hypothetical protein
MARHLAASGYAVVQTTSPLIARKSFWTVVSTIEAVGARAALVRPAFTGKPLIRNPQRTPRCGKLGGPLKNTLPLLANRLRISAPGRAKVEPRPWDLMSAPEADSGETRVMVGGEKSGGLGREEAMAILATETWQLDPDVAKAEPGAIVQPGTLAEEAPKFLAAVFGDAAVEPVAVADPELHVWAARPRKVELGGADSALVLALLISSPDGTLQTVSFHVSPVLVPKAEGCTDLAETIAASLVAGPSRLNRAAGVRELAGLGASRRLTVTVPEDYVVIHQPAEDFDRHQIYKLRPLSLYPGDLIIAIDSHPDRDVPDDAVDSAPGTLLGQPITWRGKRGAGGGYFVVTQPVPDDDRRFLQVIVRATREAKYLDEFRKVAETLELKAK